VSIFYCCCCVQIFQTGAVLEILHAGCGLVRSSVQVTIQQVFSRVYITWAVLHLLPPARLSFGNFLSFLLTAQGLAIEFFKMKHNTMYTIYILHTVTLWNIRYTTPNNFS
jgi:hypothetical protein